MNISNLKFQIFKQRWGIASLPVILLIGSIIIEIGVAGTLLLVYLNNSLYGNRLGNEALAGAQSGIDDGIMRVILDKNLSASYSLTVGRANVDVTICKDACVGLSVGQDAITATSRVLTKEHTLVAILNVSSTSGLVETVSLKEMVQ